MMSAEDRGYEVNEDAIFNRIRELSEAENAQTKGEVWNHLWLIQARQVVLMEGMLSELQQLTALLKKNGV